MLLRRYLAPQRIPVLIMAGLLLSGIFLEVLGPRIVGAFINSAQRGAHLAVLIRTALLFLGVSLGARVVKALAGYRSEQVAWTATNALRLDLIAHVLRLDPAFHKDRTPGELIERVDGDVGALAGLFSRLVVQLIGSALLLAGVIISLALVDWRLGLAFGAFAALAVGVLNGLRRRAVPRQMADREQSAQVYGFAGEVLGATEDLQSSGAEGYALQRYASQLRRWFPVRLRAELSGTAIWVGATVAFACADAIAYWLGGGLFLSGRLSLGTLFMVIAYAGALAQPIETIRRELQELQRAGAGVARVAELFGMQSRLADGTRSLVGGALAVEFRNVSFRYDDEAVLENLCFRVEAGQVLGVVGRTGCGKSTLARLLSRQYDPTSGTVLVGGIDLREAQLESLRARVGLVTQEVQLFAASLRENITLFDDAVPPGHLTAVLDDLGLGDWPLEMEITPDSISAGEAQLIAFARVCLGDPGLVILDEPSSRLDPVTEERLNRALDRLLAGRTAIIIAHRPETLQRANAILNLAEVTP